MTPKEAASRYHWVKYNQPTNTVELYLDNFMLSGARLCEAKFYLEHLLHIKPRYSAEGAVLDGGKISRKPWFFDFGEYFHWCLEQFYNHFKINKCAPAIDFWLDQCRMQWAVMRLDEYKNSVVKADVNKYEELGGWEGCAGLLVGYYAYYMDQRLRIIDTEITFGHNKEVFLGQFSVWIDGVLVTVNCYLTGRIDLLVDNGYKIGPVDHKTTASFDGFEHEDFNPHDGMTGYILAIHEIIKNYKDETKYDLHDIGRIPECMGGWIHHISLKEPSTPRDKTKKKGPRFKSTPIDKTLVQLEDYKARQLSTFKRITELLFNDKVPEWNTQSCNNIFFRKCEYKAIHEQPSDQWPQIINQFYQINQPWDTREHSNKDARKEQENVSAVEEVK